MNISVNHISAGYGGKQVLKDVSISFDADARGQHRDAQVRDGLALNGVRELARADDAVLLAADGADLGLQGQALLLADLDELGGLLHRAPAGHGA